MRSDEEYAQMYTQIIRNRLPRTHIPTEHEMKRQGIAAIKEVRLAIADDLRAESEHYQGRITDLHMVIRSLRADLERVRGERDRLRAGIISMAHAYSGEYGHTFSSGMEAVEWASVDELHLPGDLTNA